MAKIMKVSGRDIAAAPAEAYAQHQQYIKYLEVDKVVFMLMHDVLRIHSDHYAIGGSWAMIGYGISVPREPHDVDVIVPQNMIGTIKHIIKLMVAYPDATFMVIDVKETVYPSPYSRISLRYCGYSIDILASDRFEPVKGVKHCNLEDLMQIAVVKQQWAREKDLADIKLIREWVKQGKITPSPVPVKRTEDDDLPF